MSNAEQWIAWARRQAEAANGRPAHTGQHHPPDTAQGQHAAPPGPHADPFAKRQGNGEHGDSAEAPGTWPEYDPLRQRQGNEASPRRPGDPPWRGRTAHRTSTAEAMAAFRDARLRRGWSLSRAAEETDVSRPHLSLLERGLRRPSASVAADLIVGYQMTEREADAVSAIAVEWADRDSPYKTGVAPMKW